MRNCLALCPVCATQILLAGHRGGILRVAWESSSLEVACRREGSELTREVLRAAGMAPSHEEEGLAPAGEVMHEPGGINPGGGGLRGALRGDPSLALFSTSSQDHAPQPKAKPHLFIQYLFMYWPPCRLREGLDAVLPNWQIISCGCKVESAQYNWSKEASNPI